MVLESPGRYVAADIFHDLAWAPFTLVTAMFFISLFVLYFCM